MEKGLLALLSLFVLEDINGLSRSFKCRNTPIHFAAEQAHPYIVEALLQARADPDIPSDRGTTTLEAPTLAVMQLLRLAHLCTHKNRHTTRVTNSVSYTQQSP
eukprot:4136567-Amphidinium_carterae.1